MIVSLIISIIFICPTVLFASSVFKTGQSTCTNKLNCGATAKVSRGLHGQPLPFVAQVYAEEGGCLRIEVTRANKDLDMLVASPHYVDPGWGGQVWANDQDGEDGNFDTPRIVIDPVPVTGFYTVRVNGWSPSQGAGSFDLSMMRYNTGNAVNCNNPNSSWGDMTSP